MSIIDNYVKNSNDINSLQVDEPRISKSKSYLKITSIPFFPHSNSQERLASDDIEAILKQNHIFNNISLASKPRVIKVSSKSNMNPGVPQCKNCWKWGHVTFSCKIQGAKCVKCNGPHKSEYHREFGWCCKANPKINPLRLETKKGEPCPHSFKCLNCRGDYQADSNLCPFWRHRFNRKWHQKRYAEIHVNRSKSFCSEVNGSPSL